MQKDLTLRHEVLYDGLDQLGSNGSHDRLAELFEDQTGAKGLVPMELGQASQNQLGRVLPCSSADEAILHSSKSPSFEQLGYGHRKFLWREAGSLREALLRDPGQVGHPKEANQCPLRTAVEAVQESLFFPFLEPPPLFRKNLGHPAPADGRHGRIGTDHEMVSDPCQNRFFQS